ncbi:ExeA protein [Rubrivivax gelatinosus]|uniref:ExeA family protein n=1 Tax=Rubrivivax gelatinosus TaxID=28068 RepID=UPI0019046803|nr:AAA family ATPase [Rubrivivax gelatinosus]MBK1614975.1 ExeA protein [Rubrivivax gelatinosus]MBZ8142967.1 ExeA protein [Rubrivivax gelatinosus]
MNPAMTMTTMPPLGPVLTDLGVSLREFARGLEISKSTAGRISQGEWPQRGARELRDRAVTYLKRRGAAPAHLRDLVLADTAPKTKLASSVGAPEAVSPTPTVQVEKENDSMLLRNETITPAARKHFGLPRGLLAPDDIQSRDDIYTSTHARYVRAALLDAAQNCGFLAIVGESGAGKSTLREDLEERIREERRPIVLIKPWTLGMEQTEARGKPLRAGHIAEAIVEQLAPGQSLKSSPQARYSQVFALLKSSRAAGYTHLLLIEEAHRLPQATLKHLKNFLEMKDGLRRLIGVALIGQPELHTLLSERNAEVREIVQRCEQITMEPLDNDLAAYIAWKFDRAGVKISDVLADDAIDAIRARLITTPRGGRVSDSVSICYPLVVNNLVTRAINAAAVVGFPRVDAQVIAGC